MKRVAVIAIFLAVMASLFAFPVFADTPVQPLQVITYSDTTTNVRISGTAEKLHYNVDSFQVVFMSPPNNYGTACTPVLISFRFYNASDLPAYVGQPEFELTATSSTGSVNTIIYGYDQISTDLFVAESSYSTAEVGRIGIGASNDFAYYTGFVIPPRTSLYFSCIVYVNASAYAQNNTGATEDVNQVTLSTLNLYTNQISFSADYPYHNQPIDFSTIIDAISDLSETVSTSTEMQSIISMLTYSGTNYQYTSRPTSNETLTITDPYVANHTITVNRRVNSSYLIETDIEYDSSTDTYKVVGTERIPVYFYITDAQYNQNRKAISTAYNALIRGCFMPSTYYFNMQYIASNIYDTVYVEGQNIRLNYKIQSNTSNRSIIPYGSNTTIIYGYIDIPLGTSYTFPALDGTSFFFEESRVVDGYYPRSEYAILKDLYNAYSSVNGLDDISNAADDITDKSESAHTQEQSYFTQNAQAIQQTGLSNYRFNGDQENGIGSVSHDFTLLWNALGGFNSIYVFSLTLSLALMILRHAPGVIRSSRRNKEE